MSGMTSTSLPAPQESSSTAIAPVASPAAVESTNVATSKPYQDIKSSSSSSLTLLERLRLKNTAAQAHFDERANERSKKKEEEKREIKEKNKARNAKLQANKQANIVATLKYNSAPAKKQRETARLQRELSEKQRLAKQTKSKNTSKEMGQKKTEPNNNRVRKSNASTTSKQRELSHAELDSASPILASASGDVPDHDLKLLASKHLTEEEDTQDPPMANALAAIQQEISEGHSQLTMAQIEKSTEFINEICNMNLGQGDEVDLDDIPYEALQKLATWIKDQLAINQAAKENAGDLEATQVGQFEQSETQLEKLQSSAPVHGFNKHGKRCLDENDDEQVTSELSNIHRNKRARSLEPYISPCEKKARAASRRGSLGANDTPSSTYNSVTAFSTTVNGGFVPPVTGDMVPSGADGNAGLKYRQHQQQRSKESYAETKEQDSAKQVQKRRASEQLPEPMAKKLKQSDGEAALLKEIEQPTVEPMAETKPFELDDVPEKPEVASSAGDESIQFIHTATPALHTHETATGGDASATETEPITKEEAESNNVEKKVVEKSDSTSKNTSSNTNEQDATQGDNKTSQTSEEKSIESSSNNTENSTSKAQDGQRSIENNASTMTSGSATETTTQQEPAQKSKKNNAQDQVAEASKKPAKNSDNIDTDDEAQSATEKPAMKKPATTAKPKPQRKVKANNDERTTTSKKRAAKPTASAPGVKKSTSKSSAVKQPTKSTQQPPQQRPTGAARFVPTSRENRPRSAVQNVATDNKRTLTDKTNTHRQPIKSDPKKTLVASKNKQPEAANNQPTPATPAASKKRKHNGDDAVESNSKPAEKKQRQEQSKKRSRKDDEDEDEGGDAGRTKQKSKKQRANLSSSTTSSQQVPDASTSFQPDRASRSRAAAQQRAAAAAAAAAAPRQQTTQSTQYNYDLSSGGYDSEDEVQPQSQARIQASGPVDKDEQRAESEQTTGDDAQHGVKDTASGNTGDVEDTSASNSDKPQPQKKEKMKNGFIAHRKGQEPEDPKERRKRKQQESNERVLSEQAQRKKGTEKLFAKDAR